MADNIAKRRHNLLYMACGPYSLLFFLYVFFGYYTGLRVLLRGRPNELAAFIAMLGVCFVFVLVLHLAATIYESFFPADGSARSRKMGWVIWFFPLFAFSGTGFILASLFVFEGPEVVREGLKSAIISISALEATADRTLPVPEYDNTVASLKNDEVSLHTEITNPVECGVGPGAEAIIADIRNYVGFFPLLNGSSKNYDCAIPAEKDMISNLANSYDQKVEQAIDNLPSSQQFSHYRIQERVAFDDSLHKLLDNDISVLENDQGAVAQVWYFLSNQGMYYHDTADLAVAADDYNNTYTQLTSFVATNELSNIPATLDVSEAENIVSPTSLLSNIFTRISKSSRVAFYILGAILADLLAGYLWACTIIVLESKNSKIVYGQKVADTDVTNLWVPPRSSK